MTKHQVFALLFIKWDVSMTAGLDDCIDSCTEPLLCSCPPQNCHTGKTRHVTLRHDKQPQIWPVCIFRLKVYLCEENISKLTCQFSKQAAFIKTKRQTVTIYSCVYPALDLALAPGYEQGGNPTRTQTTNVFAFVALASCLLQTLNYYFRL